MRFHCLGAGSIGSLIASNLSQLPGAKVRFVLRKKDLAGALLTKEDQDSNRFGNQTTIRQHISVKIEEVGLAYRSDGLELELNPTSEELKDSTRLIPNSLGLGKGIGAKSSKFPSNLIKNDPIDSLIVTTKAPAVLNGIKPLLSRLSSTSTVVLCHNGMGVLERLLDSYWPDDYSPSNNINNSLTNYKGTGRPNFICAITTHGVWKKGTGHFVHAGNGDIKFSVVPNRTALAAIASTPSPSWGDHHNNPLLNSRSLTTPTLDHIPLTPATESLHATIKALLELKLNSKWLPLPTFQTSQLQKLAVNSCINSLTSIVGVNNGSLIGSPIAKNLIESISKECSNVFAAHLAKEAGTWDPPPIRNTFTPISSEGEEDSIESRDFQTSSSSSTFSNLPPPSTNSPHYHAPAPPLPLSHPLSSTSLIDYTLRILFSTSTNFSSTLQDILRTSTSTSPSSPTSTEIEYITGYILALGRKYSITTPVVETMGRLVKLKEEMIRGGAVDRILERRIEDVMVEEREKIKLLEKEEGRLERGRLYLNRSSGVGIGSRKLDEKGKSVVGVEKFKRAEKVLKEKNVRVDNLLRVEREKKM